MNKQSLYPLATAALLAVALSGCTPSNTGSDDPTPSPTLVTTTPVKPSPPVEPSPAPPALVGRWNGGTAGSDAWWLTINADGTYDLYNESLDVGDTGYLVLTADTWDMVSSAPAEPVAQHMAVTGCNWQYDEMPAGAGDLLTLCDSAFSYVR